MTNPYERLAAVISGEVHADPLWRHMLATDGSIFQKTPACVVYPKTAEDVRQTVRFAEQAGLSVHARGAGSGLTGGALGDGIVIDFTRFMNRLLVLDQKNKVFVCEPGYRLGQLETAIGTAPLFFPPDPSSGAYATFGGMTGTNASGAHAVKYGNVADYLLDADMVLAGGELLRLSEVENTPVEDLSGALRNLADLYRENEALIEGAYPPIRCNVAGYNLRGLVRRGRLQLRRLVAGSEGTLGIVTRLTFRLLDKPGHDALVVAYFDDIISAARATQETLPLSPAGIEIMDKSLLHLARESAPALRDKIPEDIDNAVLIAFDGTSPEACAALAQRAMARLRERKLTDRVYLAVSSREKENFWAIRKAAVPILYKLKGEKKILALIEDAAVPTDRLTDYFRGIYRILGEHGVAFVLYGHIAKGLMHTRPLLNLKDSRDVALLRSIADSVYDLIEGLGGTVSGEHGDGRLRSAYVRRRYPTIHPLFLRTKQLLDPKGRFNPEIITHHDPDQMKTNLRFGAGYRSRDRQASCLFWEEGFVDEVEKCHGCSKCTTVTTATRMCPVYKVTREEAAAPKAKANLLRALLSGKVREETLYLKSFQQVMSLCANCGSCAEECPSNVNIPKLAMEARARCVARFGASRHSRVVTRVELVGRTFRKAVPTMEKLMAVGSVGRLAQRLTGVDARRRMPAFAARPLFERIRPVEGEGDVSVLYFAGCYAGWMQPQIGEAAVRVLRAMGVSVRIPPQHCCGLPAMTKGLVADARKLVRKNLRKWGALLNAVDHIVVTCSSCGYALMKDWAALLGDDALVSRAAGKTLHISRFIEERLDRVAFREVTERAAYHQPCHLKIQPDPGCSFRLLSGLPGLAIRDLNAHCCGMIGSWGMAAENYELSRRIGADLMGKLGAAGVDVAVTDCPTCRMQMEAFGQTPVRHPVELIAERLADNETDVLKAH